jgi:signal recognition particle receptor subunit beta
VLSSQNSLHCALAQTPESKPTRVLARNCSHGAVYDDPEPTIGFNPGKTERNGMSINLWDLGGGRRIRGVWESYIDEIHGAIYMVDGVLPRRGLLVCRRCS